jgi:hypothetical protein
MEFFVPLARLPDRFAFPERLRERVAFDAERGRLIYRGFMTKCTYDELSALTDDVDYHRALEHLFVLTSAAANPQPQRRATAAVAAAAIGAIAIALAAVWFGLRSGGSDQPASPPAAAVATAGSQ